MIDILGKLGKTSAVIGENGVFIAILVAFGDAIPPKYKTILITAHAVVLFAKTFYLHHYSQLKLPPKVTEAINILDPILLGKDSKMPITNEDRAASAATKIILRSKDKTKDSISQSELSRIIFDEMTKDENTIYNEVITSLSPLQRKVLEERIALGDNVEKTLEQAKIPVKV